MTDLHDECYNCGDFGDWEEICGKPYCPDCEIVGFRERIAELEAENKRLREALEVLDKKIMLDCKLDGVDPGCAHDYSITICAALEDSHE